MAVMGLHHTSTTSKQGGFLGNEETNEVTNTLDAVIKIQLQLEFRTVCRKWPEVKILGESNGCECNVLCLWSFLLMGYTEGAEMISGYLRV